MDVLKKTHDPIWDEAAQWHARMHAADCTGRDRAEFESWLRASPDHWRAYAEAERVTRRFDQLLENDASMLALANDALAHSAQRPAARARRWATPAAMAASVLIALFATQLTSTMRSDPVEYSSFVTDSGARRVITLSDHSVVQLDVGSEITVAMSARAREITLTRGRALFEVAKDANRPFTVSAGVTRTTALGTRFQVQREESRVNVVLTEGSVAVVPVIAADSTQQRQWAAQLSPGEQLTLADVDARPIKHAVDPLVATSWSRGRLVFRDTPLAAAIDEINRYSTRKVRLADSSLAHLVVGGNFIAGDSELVVSAFAAALPLRVVDGGGGEILLFRRYQPASP